MLPEEVMPFRAGASAATGSPAARLTPGQPLGAQNAQNGGTLPASALQGTAVPKRGTDGAQLGAAAGAGAVGGATAAAAAAAMGASPTPPLPPGEPLNAAAQQHSQAAVLPQQQSSLSPSQGATPSGGDSDHGATQAQPARFTPIQLAQGLHSGSKLTSGGL